MNKQINNSVDFSAAVRGIVTYAASNETIERATQARFESRKIVADFVRTAHGMEWKKIQKPIKAAIESLAVGIVADKNGLLGVIKTCCEYGIMPTTLNADRLRKAKTWTDLNGKIIPNGYGKVHTKSGAGQKATATPTATPTTTGSKAASKAATPQKGNETIHPLHASVSSVDAPISAREHFGILFDQMLKNETFRGEYVEVLACMLEVDKATLTRCMVQARDTIK